MSTIFKILSYIINHTFNQSLPQSKKTLLDLSIIMPNKKSTPQKKIKTSSSTLLIIPIQPTHLPKKIFFCDMGAQLPTPIILKQQFPVDFLCQLIFLESLGVSLSIWWWLFFFPFYSFHCFGVEFGFEMRRRYLEGFGGFWIFWNEGGIWENFKERFWEVFKEYWFLKWGGIWRVLRNFDGFITFLKIF